MTELFLRHGGSKTFTRAELSLTRAQLTAADQAYCSSGDIDNFTSLSSSKLSKLVRDAGLLGGNLSSVDCDLTFVQAANAAGGKRKSVTYPQFLDVLAALAIKKFGSGSALPLMLLVHLLPLARKGSTPLDDEGDGPTSAALSVVERHSSAIEDVFLRYAKIPKAHGAAFASSFWDDLRRADALEPAAQGAEEASTARAHRVRAKVLDQPAWVALCSQLGLCPALLSRGELVRLFQKQAHLAPPPYLE